jgi:hypothetical protein
MLTKAEAQAVMTPYESRIEGAIRAAWRVYREYAPDVRLAASPRTQSSHIRDLILIYIRREFDGDPNVKFIKVRGMEVMCIEGKVVVRFKKMDKNKRSSNVPTEQAKAFLGIGQGVLEGLPLEATKLQAGYHMNKLRTGYTDIWITCQQGYQVSFFWALEGPAITDIAPEAMETPSTAETATRVRIRTDVAASEDEDAAASQ